MGMDFKFYVPVLPESLDSKPSAREREDALHRLWTRALSELDIRHPDPRVTVTSSVSYFNAEQVQIRFDLKNLTDTGNPGKYMEDGFYIRGIPKGWPGKAVAQQYISALWCLYLMHEAQELVTFKHTTAREYYVYGPGGDREVRTCQVPVVDPHDDGSANQKALGRTSDVAATLDWALGFGQGQETVAFYAGQARQELEGELWQFGAPSLFVDREPVL